MTVRVVCATRGSTDDFARTMTGQSLARSAETAPCELRLFEANSRGLPSVYNTAIEESEADPALLVFVHDDVLLADYFWTDRVRAGLGQFDLVGVVGNRRRARNQAGWIMLDDRGHLDSTANLSGAIGQGDRFPPQRLDVFGSPGQACRLMDGVFLAADSEMLHDTGLRFDARFSFHFYDLDLCRTAEILNLTMGTIPLTLVHAGLGDIDGAWHEAYATYLDKWRE